ncbi:MAG TPA: PQQ-dependent sugar dehydrogenase [Nitrososphaeraceae archaeon]|nr:PQQ-dependent sugar dehydrogenase [Nitrososphaeraceae archaeon]
MIIKLALMDKRLGVVMAILAVTSAIVTIFISPLDTTIPIPEPSFLSNTTNQNKGIYTIAENLSTPWAIDIAKDNRIFFTEREGKIRVIDEKGILLDEPVAYIRVAQNGGSGLLGIALHPNFTENHLIYIYHSYVKDNKLYNKILLLKEKDNKIIESNIIIDSIPGSPYNNGGRIKFGPDYKLYITTGDASDPLLAQNLSSLAGKILRLNPDGSIPSDNPFKDSSIYSYGHRNVQGIAWHPKTKQMYSSEHGPSGFDEINLIISGKNYGWPKEECKGTNISQKAIICFNPAVAPSGITFASSNKLGYQNDLIVTTLKGSHLRQIDVESGEQNNILVGYGRLRDIIESSEGTLYVLTSNTDGRGIIQHNDDKILKILKP